MMAVTNELRKLFREAAHKAVKVEEHGYNGGWGENPVGDKLEQEATEAINNFLIELFLEFINKD